jgi:TorA maturation chaperone TorD
MQEVLDILANRSDVYALLSQLLRAEPSAPFVQGLLNNLVAGGVEPGEKAGEGYRLLRQFALDVQRADIAQVTADLDVEYSRLFFTGRTDSVYPFESVYTSEERLMMQQARDDVRAAYQRHDLAKAEAFNEPEDHLAIELDFMSSLCQKTAAVLAERERDAALTLLDSQASFLREHLLVWVPRFCQDLAAATRSDFYRGVALLTQEHLEQESATVAEIAVALAAWG